MSTGDGKRLDLCIAMTHSAVGPVQDAMHPVISQCSRRVNVSVDEDFFVITISLHPTTTNHSILSRDALDLYVKSGKTRPEPDGRRCTLVTM